uniref:Intermembrane lipid transfer protein VPS13-like C-terminal domain-containing protein n=1 Tax=Oryza punctata TaxID=4537 RepID=A0A0E0JZW6_ORYPU
MENQSDYIIKFSMTLQTNNSLEFCVYPYLGVQVPQNFVFFVNIHEPIIWRLHEMIQHLKFDRISSSVCSAVSVDPILKIGWRWGSRKGHLRGVTVIVTKPIEGAKSSGVEGFVQGVGKGLIGAAAQPVSRVLDRLLKTTEGANAVKMKISSAIMAEEQLVRRRLPRAIGGDSLLYPYDDHKAAGQAILQLAEYATFLGQVDLFKVWGKFAYEDHFMLPKGPNDDPEKV